MSIENWVYEDIFTFSRLKSKNAIYWKVRIWIKKNKHYEDKEQLKLDILNFSNTFPDQSELKFICLKIAENFENEIAAIEVTDDTGQGILIYTDWP